MRKMRQCGETGEGETEEEGGVVGGEWGIPKDASHGEQRVRNGRGLIIVQHIGSHLNED